MTNEKKIRELAEIVRILIEAVEQGGSIPCGRLALAKRKLVEVLSS